MDLQARKWSCELKNGFVGQEMELRAKKWICRPENEVASSKMELQTWKWNFSRPGSFSDFTGKLSSAIPGKKIKI
jgi:hypothetical protein